jgi:hypothetical protein
MSGHLAGITVDAVREQLAALGHDDVSDDVIASFLTSLDHQVGIGNNLTSTSSSSGKGMTTNPDEGSMTKENITPPTHDTAVHVRRHGDAPSSPSHKRNNASLRRYSSKALAARTPGGSEISSSAETRVSRDDEAGAMTPSPSSAASKRAARATPNGTRVRPASSGHRTAVLAIPTKCSPSTEPKSSKTHPKTHTPSSATTRHRRAHAPNADTHEDIIGWCAKRSVQPVTPHTTRTSSSSSAATPGSSDKTKTKNKTSVIKSSMPVRPGTFTPGQRVRIDRVARAAQYNAVWSGDAYLERRGGDGTNSNKFPVFAGGAGGKVNSTSRLDFDNFENADEATVFGTKPRVEDIDVCGVNSAVYDVNGPRGGSWGRAQRKLTDGVNENRLEKGKTSSGGFWDQKRAVTRVMGTDGGFKTPGESRRDALRWEVRARMAAPPTF